MTTVLLGDRRGPPSRWVTLLCPSGAIGSFLIAQDRQTALGLRRQEEGCQHSITAKINGPLAAACLYEGCMLSWSRYTTVSSILAVSVPAASPPISRLSLTGCSAGSETRRRGACWDSNPAISMPPLESSKLCYCNFNHTVYCM